MATVKQIPQSLFGAPKYGGWDFFGFYWRYDRKLELLSKAKQKNVP